MSTLRCDGVGDFAAFSGNSSGKNNPAAVAVPDVGPLPPGRYYIVDRGSG
ncbi:tlde1 domain-containing protein, partial [Paraburkholderia sp.]